MLLKLEINFHCESIFFIFCKEKITVNLIILWRCFEQNHPMISLLKQQAGVCILYLIRGNQLINIIIHFSVNNDGSCKPRTRSALRYQSFFAILLLERALKVIWSYFQWKVNLQVKRERYEHWKSECTSSVKQIVLGFAKIVWIFFFFF